MGGSASGRCFIQQDGCRTWRKGVGWWLTEDCGKDGYGEGRRLETAGAQGPADEGDCLLEVVAGNKVACEGTRLEKVWDELKGGCGTSGQRPWLSREMGLAWCCTG